MSDTAHNGWKNYATWRVNLEIFDGMTASDITGRRVNARSELAEACKEYVEEVLEQSTSEGLALSYAMAFLQDVDWWEIADHLASADEGDD